MGLNRAIVFPQPTIAWQNSKFGFLNIDSFICRQAPEGPYIGRFNGDSNVIKVP